MVEKLTVSLYRIGIGKAAQVFFQNDTNKNFCIKHKIADDKAIVLPGSGVNLEHHSLQEYAPDGVIKFLFIARLQKDKGTEEYFKTAMTIKARYPQTEFQILGWKEGPYQQLMEDLVKAGIIKYLGTTSDL